MKLKVLCFFAISSTAFNYKNLFLYILTDSSGHISIGAGEDVNINLEDVLAFVTGATTIPPMGFDHQPRIWFKTREESGFDFPSASTCANCLYLPIVHETYPQFKQKVLFGFVGTVGFLQV